MSRRYPVACHNPAILVPLACSARVVLYTRSSSAAGASPPMAHLPTLLRPSPTWPISCRSLRHHAQPYDRTLTPAPVAYPRGAPMSPRPRMFDPPPNAPPSPPGVVKPSDLMTMEDYAKLRYSTVKRTFAGGAIGSVASVLLVRQFWPKRPSPNALVLVGFSEYLPSV